MAAGDNPPPPEPPPERPRDPERARTAAERARKAAERAKQSTDRVEQEPKREPPSPRRLGKTVKGVLRGAFLDNYAIKFVAMVLALAVFILVHSDENVEVSVQVGVSYTMPEDRVLVKDPVDQVRITLRGSRRQIERFDEREIDRVHIDLSDRKSGELYFREEMFDVPEGLEIVSITPPSTTVLFEPRARKEVPVDVNVIGEPTPGYVVEEVRATPPEVTISGAESIIAGIDEVGTREVVLDDRQRSFADTVPLVTPGPQVTFADDRFVRVDVVVGPATEARPIGALDVGVRPDPEDGVEAAAIEGFSVEPGEVDVTLRGPASAVKRVQAEDITLVVRVHSHDIATSQVRPASIVVEGLPDQVAAEVTPRQVTLHPR